MKYKAIDFVICNCPENCPHFKGEHNYCFTPFLYKEFEGILIRPDFNSYSCCTHIKMEPNVVYFENESERDSFNKNNKIEYIFIYYFFDYEYFLKIKD